jgi:hypothetical protein
MSPDELGASVRKFIVSLLGDGTNDDTWGSGRSSREEFPDSYDLWIDINNAPKLVPGHLLVVHLRTSSCYQVDPSTGDATLLFQVNWGPRTFLWRAIATDQGKIYCSVSGTIAGSDGQTPPGYRPQAALFKYWGRGDKITRSGDGT